jgi:hypothetical protein
MVADAVLGELRQPVPVSATFNARVMRAIQELPHRHGRVVPLPTRSSPRRIRIAFGAVAAGVLAMFALPSSPRTHARRVQFVLVAPRARNVKVVGDFNGWDTSHAAFHAKNRGGGVWSVTAPVPVGHHRYAFLVDDTVWVADPMAPRADEDFGTPNSALLVPDQE